MEIKLNDLKNLIEQAYDVYKGYYKYTVKSAVDLLDYKLEEGVCRHENPEENTLVLNFEETKTFVFNTFESLLEYIDKIEQHMLSLDNKPNLDLMKNVSYSISNIVDKDNDYYEWIEELDIYKEYINLKVDNALEEYENNLYIFSPVLDNIIDDLNILNENKYQSMIYLVRHKKTNDKLNKFEEEINTLVSKCEKIENRNKKMQLIYDFFKTLSSFK